MWNFSFLEQWYTIILSMSAGVCLYAGAVDYITKPFDSEEVKARIKVHIKLKSSYTHIRALENEVQNLKLSIVKLRDQLNK